MKQWLAIPLVVAVAWMMLGPWLAGATAPCDQPSAAQNVFILFYAIFWGHVSEVQAGWKAFNLPVALKVRRTRNRAMAAVAVFIALPTVLFTWMYLLFRGHANNYLWALVPPLLAAQAPFGVYRFWIALMERHRTSFYYTERELQVSWWLQKEAVTNELRCLATVTRSCAHCESRRKQLIELNRALYEMKSRCGAEPTRREKDRLRHDFASLNAPLLGVEPALGGENGLRLYSGWAAGNAFFASLYVVGSVGTAVIYWCRWPGVPTCC